MSSRLRSMSCSCAPCAWLYSTNTILVTFITSNAAAHLHSVAAWASSATRQAIRGNRQRKQQRGFVPPSDCKAACSRMLSTCVIAEPATSHRAWLSC